MVSRVRRCVLGHMSVRCRLGGGRFLLLLPVVDLFLPPEDRHVEPRPRRVVTPSKFWRLGEAAVARFANSRHAIEMQRRVCRLNEGEGEERQSNAQDKSGAEGRRAIMIGRGYWRRAKHAPHTVYYEHLSSHTILADMKVQKAGEARNRFATAMATDAAERHTTACVGAHRVKATGTESRVPAGACRK